MQERRNYYRILGVQPDASVDVIRSAYRTLMQKLRIHPDLGGDERDAAAINEAWAVLRNPGSRQAYDLRLLSDYDIRMLSSGGNPQQRPVSTVARSRRNCYRILGVQADAPQAVVESAYKTMMRDNTVDKELIAEAFAVLRAPGQRRQYDATRDGTEAVSPGPSQAAASGSDQPDGYRPVIQTYCLFCKTPHCPYPGQEPPARCVECRSPLHRLEWDADRVRRSFDRRDLGGALTYYEYWPGTPSQGRLNEITPEGLRLTAQTLLAPGQVVRVSAAMFDAVARVVHCAQSGSGFSAGMKMLTADFVTQGVFVDVKS